MVRLLDTTSVTILVPVKSLLALFDMHDLVPRAEVDWA
jgi:hypothetical protein